MQKYRTTLGCSSDSRSNATSRSANVKQSGSNRLTATERPSNSPLTQLLSLETTMVLHMEIEESKISFYTYLYTNVPSHPLPNTSLVLKVIFPTFTKPSPISSRITMLLRLPLLLVRLFSREP